MLTAVWRSHLWHPISLRTVTPEHPDFLSNDAFASFCHWSEIEELVPLSVLPFSNTVYLIILYGKLPAGSLSFLRQVHIRPTRLLSPLETATQIERKHWRVPRGSIVPSANNSQLEAYIQPHPQTILCLALSYTHDHSLPTWSARCTTVVGANNKGLSPLVWQFDVFTTAKAQI